MKKRKLGLKKVTLREINDAALGDVAGAGFNGNNTCECPRYTCGDYTCAPSCQNTCQDTCAWSPRSYSGRCRNRSRRSSRGRKPRRFPGRSVGALRCSHSGTGYRCCLGRWRRPRLPALHR